MILSLCCLAACGLLRVVRVCILLGRDAVRTPVIDTGRAVVTVRLFASDSVKLRTKSTQERNAFEQNGATGRPLS